MPYDLNEARKAVSERGKKAAIAKALEHQNRVKFHAQTALNQSVISAYPSFFAFVKNLIPADKYKVFMGLFRYPIKTNEIVDVCFNKLARVFDGRNPVYDYNMLYADDLDDWLWYRKDVLNEPKVWSNIGWEYFKTEFNSFLVVDLPTEQRGERPEPYFYWLPIDRVITYGLKDDGSVDFIAFYQQSDGAKKVVFIDDSSYRTFTEKDGNIGALLSENAHGLGFCPVRFFVTEPISIREPDVKKSVLTNELSSLDWYLFFHTSKKHLDLFGSYPILSGYERNCNYIDEHDNTCDHGFLKNRSGVYLHDAAGNLMECPKCGSKRIVGAGTFVEIPIPDEENKADLRNPVQMLTVDRNSLDYNVTEEERLKNEIIKSVVGGSEEVSPKQAVNEMQIQATFESQSAILKEIKKTFESAMEFVDSTICKLRYGESFVSAHVNLGTEFYIYSPTELREKYKLAKEAGASETELDALQTQIIETEYRNNPNQLQRMQTLADLEPFRHLTRAECFTLFDKGIISADELKFKLNFGSLINRFERENTNVVEFGTAVPYAQKINTITEKLKEYAASV